MYKYNFEDDYDCCLTDECGAKLDENLVSPIPSANDIIEKFTQVSLSANLRNDNIISGVSSVTSKGKQKPKRNKNFDNCLDDEKDIKSGRNVSKKSATIIKNHLTTRKKLTKKKKDSFIVSDSSSVDNDSIMIYHRVLTERIKADVISTTPHFNRRKKNNHEDDGIFTPFTNRNKRWSSDSDSSEKENVYNRTTTETMLKKKRIPSQKTNTLENERDSNQVHGNDACSDTIEIKEQTTASSSVEVASPTSNVFKKNLSWSFSDEDSCSSLSSPPHINGDIKQRQQETPIIPARRLSVTSTPITFRLNNVKKLTPKNHSIVQREKNSGEPISFLRSLSTCTGSQQLHAEAEPYKKKFKKLKEQLAANLFCLFNEQVFNNKLPTDMKIEWSARMRSSSGFCYNKRIKTVIGPDNECLRSSRIVLSTKIIETPERLRDTLIHEMCHAAAWIIDKKADGHGPCWKSWASKAQRTFPELPQIKRCHDYSIKTKYKYKCVSCHYTIGRHSKSLNLEKKRCGFCYGKFELILNGEQHKSNSTNVSPKNVKAKPLSKFALFVKENYGRIRAENLNLKHGEIMKILSKNFADTKKSD